MQPKFIVVDIGYDEAQLLNSKLQFCALFLAIKHVNQTIFTPVEVYDLPSLFPILLYSCNAASAVKT